MGQKTDLVPVRDETVIPTEPTPELQQDEADVIRQILWNEMPGGHAWQWPDLVRHDPGRELN